MYDLWTPGVGAYITAAVLLFFVLIFLYYIWDHGFLIDFRGNYVYRDFLIFKYPVAELSLVGGVDKVFTGADMSLYFYRMWFENDRYGEGIPISGLISRDDRRFDEIFRRHALLPFGYSFLSEKQRDLPSDCVYLYFDYWSHGVRSGKKSYFYFVSICVIRQGSFKKLARYPRRNRDMVGDYLAEIRKTHGDYMRVIFIDNRMDRVPRILEELRDEILS